MTSKMSTQEMLAKLRAGATVSQVAKAAGLTPSAVTLRVRRQTGLNPLDYLRANGWLSQTLSPELAERIAVAYRDSIKTIHEIMRDFEVGDDTVRLALQAHGLKVENRRHRFGSPEIFEEIRSRYLAGESCPALAAAYGVHEITIRRALDSAGVQRRRLGRPSSRSN